MSGEGYVQMDAVVTPSSNPSTPPPPGAASSEATTTKRGRAATVTDSSKKEVPGGVAGSASGVGYTAFDAMGGAGAATTTADGRVVQTLRRRGQTTASTGGGGQRKWGAKGFSDATPPPEAAGAGDDGAEQQQPPQEYAWRARAKTASSGSLDAVDAAKEATARKHHHTGRKHHHHHSSHPHGGHSHKEADGAADADENLDAPLLLDGASSASLGGRGGSATNLNGANEPSTSRPGRRRSSSDDGGGGASASTTATSTGREIVDKIKETSWAVTAEVLDILPNKFAAKVLVPEIPPVLLDRLFELQEAMLVPFDHADPGHQLLIPALWDALCRVRPPLPMAGDMDKQSWRSELWKDYGFQGVDPATDFRGAGLLGVRSIIWMCVEEPDISRAMLDGGYPFAIAVINIVMALLHIMHITKGKKTCLDTKVNNANYTAQEARMRLAVMVGEWRCASPTPGLPKAPRGPGMGSDVISSLEDGLMNATAEACRVLQGEWLRSSRNIMEFNTVLKAAMVRFERLLRDRETYIRVSRAIDVKYPEAPLSCAGI
jgi:hypothetical protein